MLLNIPKKPASSYLAMKESTHRCMKRSTELMWSRLKSVISARTLYNWALAMLTVLESLSMPISAILLRF